MSSSNTKIYLADFGGVFGGAVCALIFVLILYGLATSRPRSQSVPISDRCRYDSAGVMWCPAEAGDR